MKPHASLLAIGLALLAAGCNRTHEAAKPAEPRPVLVADAHFAPREEAQVLAGVIKARVESDLSFRVGGKIAARLVDAGAFVREGDALAKLDETDFRLQLEEADAELDSAKAALVQAEAEERRLITLSRQGWAANADFDRVHSAADQARAAVARADRAVALARNAMDYTTLRADADGVISAVMAEPGQVVAASAPIVRLAHTAEQEAAVSVPETLLDRARSEPARVEFWALPGVSVAARCRELSPTSDPATRTYPARFTLIGAPSKVRAAGIEHHRLAQHGHGFANKPGEKEREREKRKREREKKEREKKREEREEREREKKEKKKEREKKKREREREREREGREKRERERGER